MTLERFEIEFEIFSDIKKLILSFLFNDRFRLLIQTCTIRHDNIWLAVPPKIRNRLETQQQDKIILDFDSRLVVQNPSENLEKNVNTNKSNTSYFQLYNPFSNFCS